MEFIDVIKPCLFFINYLDDKPKGTLKQGTPRCLRLRKACSISLLSDTGSILQKEPLPGSSWDRGTLIKYLFNDKLCLIEF